MLSLFALLPLLALPAIASPLLYRQESADLTVIKFAALAELLEATFYEQALAKFDAQAFSAAGFSDGQAVLDQIRTVQTDEATHLRALQTTAAAFGGDTSSIDTCTFDFTAALTDVPTFLATARVLEQVGVGAYIGGTTLIGDKSLLIAAAEIATVEARHNTVLNGLNNGTPIPNPFDMVLSPQQVLSLAAPFVSGGCDPVAALGLTPTPQLTITNTERLAPGLVLTFAGAGLEGVDQNGLFCHIIVGGVTEATVAPIAQCAIPDGQDGPMHVFIARSATPLSSDILKQDASALVAGPALAFVDSRAALNLASGQSQLANGEHQGQTIIIKQVIIQGISTGH